MSFTHHKEVELVSVVLVFSGVAEGTWAFDLSEARSLSPCGQTQMRKLHQHYKQKAKRSTIRYVLKVCEIVCSIDLLNILMHLDKAC